MAVVLDTLVGAAIDGLLSTVLEMKDKAVKFRPTLERLETALTTLEPLVKQIQDLDRQLDRPKEEIDRLRNQIESGRELVVKCSKVKWWECCRKANYQEELDELYNSISEFNESLQVITARDVKEILAVVKRKESVELRGLCSPPQPPPFTVGLANPLRQLKHKLLEDQVIDPVVLTVTGSGGLGKSTLAKMLCWDDEVKGKFKDIFFVTFGKTPKLNTIVQNLFKHTGYVAPEFQSDDDAVNKLESLLKMLNGNGKSPMLLVLDDVWPHSESLVDKFAFQISGYKILVISCAVIKRFSPPLVLKPLGDTDAIMLFKHSASLNQNSSNVPDDFVKEIARGCGGSPLALTITGRSLSQQNLVVWHNRARELSSGHSILHSSSYVRDCLQKCLDLLDPKRIECFKDLGLFPEGQRIPAAALVDMWTELYGDDDASAMENIDQLVNWNMADIVVTRKVEDGTIDYSYHYVRLHDLLRELAMDQTSQEPEAQRNRLIIDISGNNLPKWWNVENEYQIKARILSISTDESFTSEWCNLLPTEVEALGLNLRAKKCILPMFMKRMSKLKVLIITNYDFFPAELENFELLGYISELKRIRLEKVSIPFLSKTGVQLKNLQKISFFMCNVNEAFKNCTIQVSDVLPNLVEMNIDYCNMVALPVELSNIVSMKKLSITKCHKLSALPEGIGKLVNLESLRLSSCTYLAELPESVTSLHNLKLLDISDCICLGKLPEKVGELRGLQKLNVRGCSSLSEFPSSIMDLRNLRDVICDEERAALFPWRTTKVIQADINLDWLL